MHLRNAWRDDVREERQRGMRRLTAFDQSLRKTWVIQQCIKTLASQQVLARGEFFFRSAGNKTKRQLRIASSQSLSDVGQNQGTPPNFTESLSPRALRHRVLQPVPIQSFSPFQYRTTLLSTCCARR
jgi:hypothetical protein